MANKKTTGSSAKNTTTKKSSAQKKNTQTTTRTSARKKTGAKKTQTQNVTVEAEVIDVAKIETIKEIILWVTLAISILLFLSNLGIGGVVGNAVSGFLFGVFGLIGYLFPILFLVAVFFGISNRGNRVALVKLISGGVLMILASVLTELMVHSDAPFGAVRAYYFGFEEKSGGGFIGGLIATGLVEGFGLISAYVITIILMIICVILITEKSLLRQAGARRRVRRKNVDPNEDRTARLSRIEQDRQQQIQASNADENLPRHERKISGVAFDTAVSAPVEPADASSDELNEIHMAPEGDVEVKNVNRVPLSSKTTGSKSVIAEQPPSGHGAYTASSTRRVTMAMPTQEPEAEPVEASPERSGDTLTEVRTKRPRKTIASTNEMVENANAVADSIAKSKAKAHGTYKFPPLSLLTKKKTTGNGNSKAQLEETADKLEQTLRNFGINVEVTDVTCGPTVTRYELLPEVGVRVNRITNLADDIKLNLAVTDIRIEAPIPGKAAVGIEVPNKDKVMVSFEELASSKEFKASESKVTFCAGRDIAGNVITANIAKMPHLLIAGTTGSGKSVCINTIIMSILYKASPDDVKFIMIDPKVVELSIYNGIPHLLIPVVTEPKKAAGALHWAVTEMDDRYQKFADTGVRDIKSYNKKLVEHNYQLPINSNGELGTFEKMPEMVVIVDELADLMMVAAKEVEESICRLAQKARAAGIYLILATQRPSVDVVTGLIKANMPSRIAFAVNSGVDSRTILDMFGAEKLLGNGDMLYYPQGYTKPLRVQGAFVSDAEVQAVVDYIKGNNEEAFYDEKISQVIDSGVDGSGGATAIGGGSGFEDEVDSYFAEAGRLIVSKEKGSIGMLQRNFKIGFNRAARIMDQLEEAGVVGPEVGTKPRSVLMNATQFEQYLNPSYSPEGTSEDEYPVSDDF